MQSSHIFVVAIVAMSLAYALLRSMIGGRDSRCAKGSKKERAEADQMMARIAELEERIRVLEKIVTDPRESLSRQIDRL